MTYDVANRRRKDFLGSTEGGRLLGRFPRRHPRLRPLRRRGRPGRHRRLPRRRRARRHTIRARFTWFGITPGHAHWEQAFSLDKGRTWLTNWHMDFTRRA
ncbi:hypothetical protein [Streptomyces bauhiniae]|uniref:Uncharacterized protein n=1 Tax=Streptomyces bauhiniae TaxID=2340725 RepID=A0A7K3QK90_9ACTN|nr:hypothetical protein [Streptomyces bauhiniae]NEB90307.1 hypothetical protein [Streptomyces bauhiniae]